MKKLFFILLLFVTIGINGQNSSQTMIGLYRWNAVVFIQRSDFNGEALTDRGNSKTFSIIGQKFRVLQTINNDAFAVIQILDYNKTKGSAKEIEKNAKLFYEYNFKGTANDYKALQNRDVDPGAYDDHQVYFTVPIVYITNEKIAIREDIVQGGLAAGVINFPFKYRPQRDKSDFSGAFNFGAGIGYKFRHKSWRQFTYSVISGYSISNIVMDSSNANKNQGKLASSNNYTAFSFSIGMLAEYQRVQAGIFLGWDKISRLNQREFDWQFQGKPWISVGFGFAIFSTQKEKGSKDQEQGN